MKIGKRTNLFINIVGGMLLFLTIVLKILYRSVFSLSLIRAGLYMLIFLLWMVSIRYRVVQKNVRNKLTNVALLELFWILVRTVKYQFIKDNVTDLRYAWYLYYLPLLMIPSLCVLLSLYLGKPENYKQKNILNIFPIISALLFALVITNDIHSLVFVIPEGLSGLEVGNYSYGAGFVVIIAYIVICAAISYGVLIVKCRKPDGKIRRALPLLPILIDLIISVLNALGNSRLFGFYQIDITVLNCLCITITLELCIQSRLIPTNSGYDELFKMSGIRAVITDDDFLPVISSYSYDEIDDLKRAENEPVILDNGFRLSCAKLKHGNVLWQDDITEMNTVLTELSEKNDYLQGKSATIKKTYEYQKKERQLIEKNRLYNHILSQTKTEIEKYARLVEELAVETDKDRELALAVKIAFVSGFIKRRENLYFLSEEEKLIDSIELSYGIEELLSALRLYGIGCSCSNMLSTPLSFECISALYENFYKIIYGIIDRLLNVCVYVNEINGVAAIVVRITFAEGVMPPIISSNINAEPEGDEWVVTICG